MGMTIDECISWILTITEHEGEDIPIYDTDVEAIKIAVSTMRKYQKIEQAYKKYLNDMVTNIYADSKFIRALREVLEDGNDD